MLALFREIESHAWLKRNRSVPGSATAGIGPRAWDLTNMMTTSPFLSIQFQFIIGFVP